MTRKTIEQRTTITVNKSYEGESIEKKMARVTETKEPIEATSPQMYTERSQGVLPETDIRTDRWEIAREAMDKVNKATIAKRTATFETKEPSETIQATTENSPTTN